MKNIVILLDKNHKPIYEDTFVGISLENLESNVIFKFEDEFVDGNAEIEVAFGDKTGIIENITKVDESYVLPIKSSLLTKDHLLLQLVVYQENERVYKSQIVYLKVLESINASDTIPDEYPTWVNTLNTLVFEVNAKLDECTKAINQANNLNITANKENGDTTVVITKKTGVTQTVHILDGEQGETGVGITSIAKTATSGLDDTYTITYSDGTTSTFTVTNGSQGAAGVGITSITKTGTSGLVDTYTITYSDNTTSTFTVTNGAQGETGATGNGISSISKTSTVGNVDTYTITYTNGTTSTFNVTNGVNPNIYSSSEEIIGTWTDNKPIYRIIISDNYNLSTSGAHVFNTGITDFGELIKMSYVITNGNYRQINNSVIAASGVDNTGRIYLYTGANWDSSIPIKFIIEYTKSN